MPNQELINPFNEMGELHNNCLNYIIQNINISTPTIEEVISCSADYATSYIGIENPTQFQKAPYTFASKYAINFFQTGYVSMQSECNSVVFNLLQSISKIVKDSNRNTIIQNLTDVEQKILITPLDYISQSAALAMVAVGKSSAAYWNYQYDNYANSPWKPYMDQYQNPENLIPNWVDNDMWASAIVLLAELKYINFSFAQLQASTITAIAAGAVVSAVGLIWGWASNFWNWLT